MEKKTVSTRTLTGMALLTAVVVILQFLGAFVRFGPFSISLVLIPIVVGAALYGPLAGAWFGFVFGLVVLLSGDAAAFLVVSPLGTILTVLLKGSLAGLCAGLVYKALSRSRLSGRQYRCFPARLSCLFHAYDQRVGRGYGL